MRDGLTYHHPPTLVCCPILQVIDDLQFAHAHMNEQVLLRLAAAALGVPHWDSNPTPHAFPEVDPEARAFVANALSLFPSIDVIDLLVVISTKNRLLSETSPTLAAATGAATNGAHLTGTANSHTAEEYMVGYLTKDGMEPAALLPFISASVEHCREHESRADDTADPAALRTARFLVQRCVNRVAGHTELGLQQAAANILGIPAHWSSHRVSYLPTKSLVAYQRQERVASGEQVESGASGASKSAPSL